MVFKIQYSYFEYMIILFGLLNAPIIFQIYINWALASLVNIFCIIHLNNILVYLEINKKHIIYL